MSLSSDTLQTQEKDQRANFAGENPSTVKSVTGLLKIKFSRKIREKVSFFTFLVYFFLPFSENERHIYRPN